MIKILSSITLFWIIGILAAGCTTGPDIRKMPSPKLQQLAAFVQEHKDDTTLSEGWHELDGDAIKNRFSGRFFKGYDTSRRGISYYYDILEDGRLRYGTGQYDMQNGTWWIEKSSWNMRSRGVTLKWFVLTDGTHLVMMRYFHNRRYFNILVESPRFQGSRTGE